MGRGPGPNRVLCWFLILMAQFISISPVCAEWTSVNPSSVSSNWELLGLRGMWAVGQDLTNQQGVLLHFSNGLWTALEVPIISSDWGLAAIDFGSAYDGWAVGQDNANKRGALLHYDNGAWTSVEPLVEISSDWGLSAVDSISSTGGWMAGQDFANKRGVLLHYDVALVTPPVVSTTDVSAITTTAATSGGTITSDGGASVTARGVCWDTSINPAVGGNCTDDGTGTGTFTSSIAGLTPSTRYHVRAYATNAAGTGYGNDVTFITLATSVLPALTTTPVTFVNSSTVTTGGTITSIGLTSVIQKGVCWGTSLFPDVSGTCTQQGPLTLPVTVPVVFTSLIQGLTPGTTYHVRAYATNSVGTGYGNDVPFTIPLSDRRPQNTAFPNETDTTPTLTQLVLTPATLPDVSADWGLSGIRLIWAVGQDNENKRGVLLYFASGSWVNVEPPDVSTDWGLLGVDAISPNEAWAVGRDNINRRGVLLHFVNGSWTSVQPPDVSSDWGLSAVNLISPNEGWAAGQDSENKRGVLLHYINASWTPVDLPNVSSDWGLSAIDLISSNQGWAVGKTTDGQDTAGVLLQYAVPLISVSPPSLNYHEVEIGSLRDQTVIVRNTGNGNLIIGTVSAPSSPFAIAADGCSGKSLASLQTCGVIYRFLPGSDGTFSDSSTIPSNESTMTVTLTGTGATGTVNYIHLLDPPNGQTFPVCPDLGSSLFQWESSGVFTSSNLLFSLTADFSNIPLKVRGNPGVNQITLRPDTWKKVLLFPGVDGGLIYWTVIATKKDKTRVEGDVFFLEVAGAEPVANPAMSHTSKGTFPPPTLSWENQCNTKFKAWFGNSANLQTSGAKKVAISTSVKDPNGNQGISTVTLTSGQWTSIRKLGGNVTGAVLYWYVESWDTLGREKKTDVMSFVLTD
jgi:hypothetical protein